MPEFKMNWDAMNASEKFSWLSQHVLGNERSGELGDNDSSVLLIHACEQVMSQGDTSLWMKNVVSEVSASVYRDKTDAQIQSSETLWEYYQFMHTAPVELRARAIYFSKRGLQV